MARSRIGRLARVAVLSLTLVAAPLCGVSMGQADAGGGGGGTNTAARGGDDDGFEWGWLGLLGLVGLAGLTRRREADHRVHRPVTA